MASHFADRLCEAVRTKKTSLIVGLDPVYTRLPEAITSHRQMNDEYDAAAAVDAIFDFCTQVIRIVAPMVPAVKINIAFFEKYLWEGLETYYNLITEADDLGVEIIGDVKRGDIGHTAKLYAAALSTAIPEPTVSSLLRIWQPNRVKVSLYWCGQAIHPRPPSRISQTPTAKECTKSLPI